MKKLNKILLIDDDELVNYIHQQLLILLNASDNIEIAINGKEALKVFQYENNEIPELVFLEIDMPIMNGFEFLEEIHNNHKHILEKTKFIILTKSLDILDLYKAKDYKIYGYLNKPLGKEIIYDILESFDK